MGADSLPDHCSREADHGARKGVICMECGFDSWRAATHTEAGPIPAPVPGEGQDAREADDRRWKIDGWRDLSDRTEDPVVNIEGPEFTGTIEVVPASERDRLAGEVEQLREDMRRFRTAAQVNTPGSLQAFVLKVTETWCAPASDETGETT